MALELDCKIVRKLPVQSGNSARGQWSKQEFVVEYQDGQYPAQVCMNVWGADKVNDLGNYQVGDKVKISFKITSREFNGRWYTDIRVWRLEHVWDQQTQQAGAAPQQPAAPAAPAPQAAPQAPAPTVADDFGTPVDSMDDLPF